MVFSSLIFLYYFLPVLLFLYCIVPTYMKNMVLFVGSLVFYGWGEPKFIIMMLISITAGYVTGLMIEIFLRERTRQAGMLAFLFAAPRERENSHRLRERTRQAGFVLVAEVVFQVGMLVYFKFSDVFPVGISFYSFQILSYVIDVYRGKIKAQKNFFHLATYVSMFPQLIAGPIVRYEEIEGQIIERRNYLAGGNTAIDDIAYGIRRFVLGLGKKVLLANNFGQLCQVFQISNDKSVLFFWLYAVAFTLQVYFDFSGYSDMAIGLGRILGFRFMENFNYPYISRSVTEFWRRWHMSLGQWFRDYVYIPLGGNQVTKGRWLFNIFVVWLLTGFWHGAEWNFIAWGLYFALLLVLEKVWLSKYLEKNKVLSHGYLLIIILIGFVIFHAVSLSEAIHYIGAMLGTRGYPLVSEEFFYYIRSYGVLLVIGMFGATPIGTFMWYRGCESVFSKKILSFVEITGLFIILLLVTAYLVDGSFNPFLYFRF